jgi:hypothetical protein
VQSISTSIICNTKIDLGGVKAIKSQRQSIVVDFAHISLTTDNRSEGLHICIPGPVQVAGHEAKRLHVWFHGLGIEPAQVPIIRRQCQTYAILSSKASTHLLNQKDKVVDIGSLATTSVITWILPIKINALTEVSKCLWHDDFLCAHWKP